MENSSQASRRIANAAALRPQDRLLAPTTECPPAQGSGHLTERSTRRFEHPDWRALVYHGAVSQLTVIIAAPAVDGAVSRDATCVRSTCADRDEHVATVHRDGNGAGLLHGAVAKLAVAIRSPTVGITRRERTRVLEAGCNGIDIDIELLHGHGPNAAWNAIADTGSRGCSQLSG